MPPRKRTTIGGLTSGEKRVVYMSQLIDALPSPLPQELLLPVKHLQEMVRHYNGHAAAIHRLNEKIESQRKRLAELESIREKQERQSHSCNRFILFLAHKLYPDASNPLHAFAIGLDEWRAYRKSRQEAETQLPEVSNDNCIG